MKKSSLIICLIIAFGFLIRIISLGAIPAGFTPDEASQGYAAYSLLKTGKDEWGLSWPLTSFRAFADYRAPLQTYLIIPSVALFGLNEFAVRLPSAIFGTLAILSVFLLANKLYPKKIKVLGIEFSTGHLAGLFMALSPWSIQFSRTALEANFASFLFPLGLFLFIEGLTGNRKYFYWSAVIFGIDLYSYLAAKLFIPVFLFFFVLLFWKKVFAKGIKFLVPFAIIFLIFATPIYLDALFGPGNVRGKDLIITNYSIDNLRSISDQQYLSPMNKVSPVLTRLFSNKITFTVHQFITNYVSYLSPTFWFTEGGREITYSVFPGYGLLYLWMFPLIVFSIYYLFSTKSKFRYVFVLWLFLGIVPAAITKEGYRPNRSGSLMGYWEIIAAIGFIEIFSFKFVQKYKLIIPTILVMLISFASYLNLYFFLSQVLYPSSLSYGYRELLSKTILLESHYQKIIFDKGSQSQIFVAFYKKMDPTIYQSYSKIWWPVIIKDNLLFLDMMGKYDLVNYTFKGFDPSADLKPGNLVVIGKEKYREEFAPFVVDKVMYPDNTVAFYLLNYVKK